ncbi:MAG: single-stranded DNA-binding protein [Bacteroidales bacterium]|jgi:single-strand DNA-binding protein|nr:single-stranded DNA-binding protein [Bacteroidales bacterium]
MNNLNSILIEGNLTKDPDLSYTSSSAAVCKFPIAVNRKYKVNDQMQDEVSYIDIEAWNKIAESCSQYLTKGRGVRVVGRLKQERWQQNGQNRSKIIIVAEHIEFKHQFQEKSNEL